MSRTYPLAILSATAMIVSLSKPDILHRKHKFRGHRSFFMVTTRQSSTVQSSGSSELFIGLGGGYLALSSTLGQILHSLKR
jgi:hypothetical protein